MDYSQSVFWPHHYEDLDSTVSSNASLPSPFRIKRTFQANYTQAQIALILIPSVVLLLLFPIRAFQLRRASLKVLPNYIGAIKTVACSRAIVTEVIANSFLGAHYSYRSSGIICSGSEPDI
jgi:hypothetical protein